MSVGEYLRSLRDKIVRDPLPPVRVAAGWALGMFVGCFVPFGLQLVVSVPIAVAARVSKIGATVGTLITNPVTILFIYPAQTWVGGRLIGHPLSWQFIDETCLAIRDLSLLSSEGWTRLGRLSGVFLADFFAGGLLLALVCTPVTYFLVLNLVRRHRAFVAARGDGKGR